MSENETSKNPFGGLKVRFLEKQQYGHAIRVPGEVLEIAHESHFRGEFRRPKLNKEGKPMMGFDGKPLMELVHGPKMEWVHPDTPEGIPKNHGEDVPAPPKRFKNRQQVFEHAEAQEAALARRTTEETPDGEPVADPAQDPQLTEAIKTTTSKPPKGPKAPPKK